MLSNKAELHCQAVRPSFAARQDKDRKLIMIETHMQTSVREVLASLPYFQGVSEAALSELARVAIRRKFEAGQVVFIEGEPCAGLYVVQEGWLKSVKISPKGREQVIRFVGPGDSFNEIGVFAGGLNQVTVEALEPATVWILPRLELLRLINANVGLCDVVIRNLAQRVTHLLNLVEDLSLRSVESRLARLLLEQSSEGVVSRRRWSTQAEMAARLGTVPDVINRALRGLVEEGLISMERHQIHILNRPGLEDKAMVGE